MDAVRVQLQSILRALGPDVATDVAVSVIKAELKRSFPGVVDHVHLKTDDVMLVDATTTGSRDGSERDHATG
jgi:hypothetical protein